MSEWDGSNKLVGLSVIRGELEEGGGSIRLFLTDGRIAIGVTYGDCCSSTWIEDFLNSEALEDATIMAVEDLNLPEHLTGPTKTDHYEEEMSYYGLAIKTAKGTCTIAYRNSSNGYYGGSIEWSING